MEVLIWFAIFFECKLPGLDLPPKPEKPKSQPKKPRPPSPPKAKGVQPTIQKKTKAKAPPKKA